MAVKLTKKRQIANIIKNSLNEVDLGYNNKIVVEDHSSGNWTQFTVSVRGPNGTLLCHALHYRFDYATNNDPDYPKAYYRGTILQPECSNQSIEEVLSNAEGVKSTLRIMHPNAACKFVTGYECIAGLRAGGNLV